MEHLRLTLLRHRWRQGKAPAMSAYQQRVAAQQKRAAVLSKITSEPVAAGVERYGRHGRGRGGTVRLGALWSPLSMVTSGLGRYGVCCGTSAMRTRYCDRPTSLRAATTSSLSNAAPICAKILPTKQRHSVVTMKPAAEQHVVCSTYRSTCGQPSLGGGNVVASHRWMVASHRCHGGQPIAATVAIQTAVVSLRPNGGEGRFWA